MDAVYVHSPPESEVPELPAGPSRVLLVAEAKCSAEWRARVCTSVAKSGCLYFLAWGVDAEVWHDTVDETNLEEFNFCDIPEHRFIMTTWHADEPLNEAIWFAKHNAFHPSVELTSTVILHVCVEGKQSELVARYASA